MKENKQRVTSLFRVGLISNIISIVSQIVKKLKYVFFLAIGSMSPIFVILDWVNPNF